MFDTSVAPDVSIHREERGADSTFVERITLVRYDRTVDDWTTPDGCWDIVIRRVRGRVEVLQTGLITRPIRLDYEAGDECVCISFKPGVFMPHLPGSAMLNRGVVRPTGVLAVAANGNKTLAEGRFVTKP